MKFTRTEWEIIDEIKKRIVILAATATATFFIIEARKPLPPRRNIFDRV